MLVWLELCLASVRATDRQTREVFPYVSHRLLRQVLLPVEPGCRVVCECLAFKMMTDVKFIGIIVSYLTVSPTCFHWLTEPVTCIRPPPEIEQCTCFRCDNLLIA